MTSLNFCACPEVDKLLLEHDNRPMKALYEALLDRTNQSVRLPMAIIMDPRCGIERRAEEADVRQYIPDVNLVGATPLMLAAYEGRVDVANDLLAAGSNPNAKASDGGNSLKAAAHEGNLEATEILISYGADINARDEEGKTPLHYAAGLGRVCVIKLLERSGANLEAVDKYGLTPLHEAAFSGEAVSIEALLKLGANQAAVDNEGRTPLHVAVDVGFDAIEAFRCNVAAFKANLIAVNKDGRTPLQVFESHLTRGSIKVSIFRGLLTPE